MISIALYKPDIPQNTAAVIRLAACLGTKVHVIEPCGFNLEDPRFKRVVMDYVNICKILRYDNFELFKSKNSKNRLILMTTKSNKNYNKFKYKKNDVLLFGRESAGVPIEIHKQVDNRLRIPIKNRARSLNIAMSAAIVVSEALNQNKLLK